MKEDQRCQTISDFTNIKPNDDSEIWRIKYESLLKENEQLRKKNAEMEDRFLHIVEKVEGEKKQLSDEIDHLVQRLEKATTRTSQLETDCNRYKADCAQAVRLLRNQQGSIEEEPKSPNRPTFVEDSSRTKLFGFSNVFIV